MWLYRTDEWDMKSPVWTNGSGSYWRYTANVRGHLPSPALRPSALLNWQGMESFKNNELGTSTSSFGAEAWNRFRPTRSGAELGIFLGEIREVPRMLMTTAKSFNDIWRSMGGSRTGFGPRRVADNWLNTQFGWMPFISDLKSFYNTTSNISRRLDFLRRNNGQWVRRRGTVLTDNHLEASGKADSPPMPGVSTVFRPPAPYGDQSWQVRIERRVWFEGAFRFWIPGKPGSAPWTARALAQIYGLHPSPSLVWELTPWSWLIDWCANVGDVINNVSSMMFDNLCARYAYVMQRYLRKAEVSATSRYVAANASATWFASTESKHRVAASPFGFGLTSEQFSARQWSILGALGISRLRV